MSLQIYQEIIMYKLVLNLHNISRWVVLLMGLVASYKAIVGWLGKKNWTDIDRKVGIFFTISIDIQLLIGFLLYFIFSEWALKAILKIGLSQVIETSVFRYFAIDHVFYMALGFVFAHLGSALPKKVDESQSKFKRAALWIGLSTILIIIGIPWGRPLFPGF
jgi:hypothetical protein